MIFRELKMAAQMLIPWWYVWKVRDPFSFLFQTQKCNQDFNETILETLSISGKVLEMLLTISDNVHAARLG